MHRLNYFTAKKKLSEMRFSPQVELTILNSPVNFLNDRIDRIEKSFRNLIKSNRNMIVFTIFPIDLKPNGRPIS